MVEYRVESWPKKSRMNTRNTSYLSWLLVLIFSCTFSLHSLAEAGESAEARCNDLYRLSDANHAIEPGVVVTATDKVQKHCRVRGVIDTTIRFELSMPTSGWTGRFLFQAPGGLAGTIGDTTTMLSAGFAASTTDSGHEGENDPSFYRDDNAKINFAFRSNHLTAVVSKKLIAAFYGREVEYSYLWGCSKGGHGALMEALRYPEDFDGIIAGAPAVNLVTDLPVFAIENSRWQQRHPLDAQAVRLLDINSTRACDLLDGAEDGIVSNPKKCTIELLALDKLVCKEGQSSGCLTSGQVEHATFVYTGLKNESGEVVIPGVYPGAETGGDFELWITGPVPFLPDGMAGNNIAGETIKHLMHRDPEFDLKTFDTLKGRAAVAEAASAVSLPKPDFSDFMARGGKLIVYNGWNDHPCRAAELESFYAQAQEINGTDALAEHMRVFMVPGMVHCFGGPGAWAADYYQAIVDWVEKDKVPETIIARHPGEFTFLEAFTAVGVMNWHEEIVELGAKKAGVNQFTRPLCPYPTYARYDGTGDINTAESFSCVQD